MKLFPYTVITAVALLSGCPSVKDYPDRHAGSALAHIVPSRSALNLQQLWIEGVMSEVASLPVATIHADSDRVTFSWNGDAVELLNALSRARGLTFGYAGVRLPLPVDIEVQGVTYANVLRMIEMQTAWRASIVTYPEANRQHGYLMQQYTRMLSLFNDTYGHVFARDAGDIDLRDVVHNDRIMIVLVPALELSATESSTLGRLYQSQLAMILSQDLGEKLEGRPEDNMTVRKFKDRFPLLWIIDEVGAGYSEKLGELATQIRSLGYCLLLAGQEVQRLKTAAGDAVWTLIANMGTRITGKIMDPKDTLEILQLMAGTEYRAHMSAMMQQGSLLGSGLSDDPRIQVSEKKKVDVEEVQSLQEGENVTLFRGQVVRGSSLYIADADKFTKEAVRINRFMEVSPPSEDRLLAGMSHRLRRSYVRADRVQQILRALDAPDEAQNHRRLVLTDPALATVCEFALECEHCWKRPVSAPVRASVLWRMVMASLPVRGRGYRVRLREPRRMGVGREAIEKAAQNYVAPAPLKEAGAEEKNRR